MKKDKGRREGIPAIRTSSYICIMPTDFLIIEICQLSIRSPIRNWHVLSCMAGK